MKSDSGEWSSKVLQPIFKIGQLESSDVDCGWL